MGSSAPPKSSQSVKSAPKGTGPPRRPPQQHLHPSSSSQPARRLFISPESSPDVTPARPVPSSSQPAPRQFLSPKSSPHVTKAPPVPVPQSETMLIDIEEYDNVPSSRTIIYDKTHDLRTLGIAINTQLKVAICVECGRGLNPASITSHIKSHSSYSKPVETLTDDLQRQYGILPLQHILYPNERIQPVFGVAIRLNPLIFCGACHHGFSTDKALRSHQTDPARCSAPRENRTSYTAYGQTLTRGQHKRYFPVDVSCLSRRSSDPFEYATAFASGLEPLPDYSKMPVYDIEDKQNLDSFLHSSMWLDVVKGLTPEQVVEAVRLPDHKTEPWGFKLQEAAHRALYNMQSLVSKTQGYGLAQDLAQVNPS